MKRTMLLLAVLAAVLAAGSAWAETVAGLPLHVKKFEGGAIRVWIGDHISTTGIVAIPTEKGVVVIGISPDLEASHSRFIEKHGLTVGPPQRS